MILFKIVYHCNAIIKKMLIKIIYLKKVKFGKRVTFRSGFTMMVDRNAKVIIGDDVFFNKDCTIDSVNTVMIGNGTIFGESVKIYDHNHNFNHIDQSIKKQGYSSKEVIIGDHCWIGSNVVIVKGAKIGDNVVVGAGIVVSFEIPSNTIVKIKSDNYIMEKMREVN